ncbi:MAG TPA: prolyl oligopeptidase family serine peptidase [Candidatus Polarisedimenticolaceae bacterium]|nr:prolyl oligopeptidase family serine peptidase [Candidatus Polarisedimenticolaceae bacterium]
MIALSLALALLAASPSAAPTKAPLPDTPKKPVVDEYQGVKVSDDYRWLENADDPAVKAWGDAQTAHTRAFLDALSFREPVRKRLDTLIRSSSESYFGLVQRGGVLFALKLEPKKQQPYLVTRKNADDAPSERVIVDPNVLDASGKIAIDFFVPSLDGKRVAVSLSRNGSEAGDVHLYDVAGAKEIGELLPRVNNGTAGGSVAFAADGNGFWYTRYPRGNERPPEDAGFFQQVYFHKIGTRTEDDVYEIGKDFPRIGETTLEASEDGRYVVAQVKNGDGGEVEYFVRETSAAPGRWTQVSTFADRLVNSEIGLDGNIYFLSRKDAPKGKIIRVPLSTPTVDRGSVAVPEGEGAIAGFTTTKTRLYVVSRLGGPADLRVFDLATGRREKDVPVLDVSSVGELARLDDGSVLFNNVSYLKPPAWYRFDPKVGQARQTALAVRSAADFSDCELVREFAVSKDGTKIPLNILRRRGTKLDGRNPTLLYAYGGFGISEGPNFSAPRRVWLEQGGVYVVANIRGGGEYGDQWHLDGNLLKKQNVFDDFYAAARWLVEHGYTKPEMLAINGGSNGGLLMGAVLTQHPEMYRVVASRVGIYDMLRVETTQNGQFNVTEYGSIKDPAQFRALYGYSPLHHVKTGVVYPSVILTTGAYDPRVDSWHSKKFAAALQATGSPHPVLLRINFEGHGIGTSLDEFIAETADLYSFIFHELGVTPKFPMNP